MGTITDRGRRWRRRAAVLAVGAALATVAPGGSPPVAATSELPHDGSWVVAVYRDLLDRDPTPAQLHHRQDQRAAGVPRRVIADEVVGGGQHARVLVDRLYRRILGRPADASSAAFWVDQLLAGRRDAGVAGFVYGSPELYQRAGGTPEDYVTFLYTDVLGRRPDAAGLSYWSARVEAGENRTRLARTWYLTQEAAALRAGLLFVDLLHRPPSPTERADWAGRIQRFDVRRIEAALVATDEYRNLSFPGMPGDPPRPHRLTAGNGGSSAPSISADGRIVAFVSTAGDLTPAGSPPGADVFVLDRRTGRTRAVTASTGYSSAPQVSADGSTVVFQSAAADLVAGDDNGKVDVFRAPTAGGPVERLTDGNDHSTEPSVSGDGTVVAFRSKATDLVATDPNGTTADIYVRTDGSPATVERVSASDQHDADSPDVSADGGTLVFSQAGGRVVPLPLGPTPEPEALEGSGATVAADGRRVLYLVVSPTGHVPTMAVHLAALDEDRRVTGSHRIAGPGYIFDARIAGDGAHAVFTAQDRFDGFTTDDHVVALEPDPAAGPKFPLGSDVDHDAGLLVATRQGQLVLYEVAR